MPILLNIFFHFPRHLPRPHFDMGDILLVTSFVFIFLYLKLGLKSWNPPELSKIIHQADKNQRKRLYVKINLC